MGMVRSEDKVQCIDIGDGTRQRVEIGLPELRDILLNPPVGPQEVLVDVEVDLTDANEKYVASTIVIPAGCVLRYVGAIVLETVTGGSSTVKLGIGLHAGDVDAYGTIGSFDVNASSEKCLAVALSAETTIDVNGIVSDGSALGEDDLSTGKVRIVAIYDSPASLSL